MTREQARREIDSLDFYLQNHTDDYGEESHTAMMMAKDALSCSEKPNKWIPVSERLPEERGDYLVTTENLCLDLVVISIASYSHNLYEVDEYDFAGKKRPGWYEYDGEWGYRMLDGVIAWMPLPEPYEEVEE